MKESFSKKINIDFAVIAFILSVAGAIFANSIAILFMLVWIGLMIRFVYEVFSNSDLAAHIAIYMKYLRLRIDSDCGGSKGLTETGGVALFIEFSAKGGFPIFAVLEGKISISAIKLQILKDMAQIESRLPNISEELRDRWISFKEEIDKLELVPGDKCRFL